MTVYTRFTIACLLLTLGIYPPLMAQGHEGLRNKIRAYASNGKCKVGVAIRLLETGDTLCLGDAVLYPMQSVFKFPIAMSLLIAADKGEIDLNQRVHIKKEELKKTVSALYDKYPDGNIDVPLLEVLSDMVTKSDNNACDIIMKILGGGDRITRDIHRLGVPAFTVKVNEAQMSSEWPLQYLNVCRPSAQIQLLDILLNKPVLSNKNRDLLLEMMHHTFVTPNRIRRFLPAGTPLAHRSGTSSTKNGLSPATNDVGLITLPNGNHLAIAVFVAESYEEMDARELIIANIAKAAYDEFSSK